jgi:broad-specificity NMP kinase
MVKRNYLVEGVSGTGKSSVCDELRRRGYKAINGDRELAYRAILEREKNEQKVLVMSTIYGTLIKSEK